VGEGGGGDGAVIDQCGLWPGCSSTPAEAWAAAVVGRAFIFPVTSPKRQRWAIPAFALASTRMAFVDRE